MLAALEERLQRLEARVAERTLALQAADAAKTRFLAAASHDLRQPVVTIGLMIDLLREHIVAPAQRQMIDRFEQVVDWRIAAALAVWLVGYVLLIPGQGVMGAIAATLLAQSVRLGLFLWLSQRRVRLEYRLGRIALLAACCGAAAAPKRRSRVMSPASHSSCSMAIPARPLGTGYPISSRWAEDWFLGERRGATGRRRRGCLRPQPVHARSRTCPPAR